MEIQVFLTFLWALAFLTPITARSDSVFVSSWAPGSCRWSLYSPFYIWAPSESSCLSTESSCLSMQASCHLCLVFCTLLKTLLELVGGDPWKSTSCPGLLSRTASFGILPSLLLSSPVLWKSGAVSLLYVCSLLSGSWASLFTVTVAKVPLNFMTSCFQEFFLFCKYEAQ